MSPAFFDTGILVAGLIEIGEASTFPQRIMAAIAEGRLRQAVTAWHCCLEFYSVATRLPEEFRLDPEDALRLLEHEVLARFEVRSSRSRAGSHSCAPSSTSGSEAGITRPAST